MNTIEKHLEQASSEVRRQIGQTRDREPASLYVRVRHRRAVTLAGTIALALGALLLPAIMFTGESKPSGFAASQPSTPEEPVSAGAVTFEQYETAYAGYVECLRDAGYTVEGPLQFGRDPGAGLPLELGGETGIDPTIYLQRLVVGDVAQGPLDAADAKCREDHLGDIERRWIDQESAKFVGMREWIDNLLACAEISGIEIPESLSYDEMLNEVGTDPSDDIIMNIASQAIIDHGCRPWQG
jgi:hypothetical protein